MSKTVTKDSTVLVHYTGTLPETGQLFDTSREDVAKENDLYNEERDYNPLEVPMGEQKVIPGFERALMGMEVGETKTVEISPEDAYGSIDDEKVVDVPDDQFKENDITPQLGMMIQTNAGTGRIVKVNEDENEVTLDFNHPLAGQTLQFDLEVVEIK